jgi:three-Cys-motif partner protein
MGCEPRLQLGVSPYTLYKQWHLGAILQTHLRVCRGILKRTAWAHESYHYYDLHAGPGIYPHNGLPIKGSPIIFLENLLTVDVQCKASFFEIDDDRRTELVHHVAAYNKRPGLVLSFHGDHERFLPCIFDGNPPKRPRKVFGLVYADPSGSNPPFALLARMFAFKWFSTLDVLIYFSATNYKRQLMAPECPTSTRLQKILDTMNKRYWIIREPYGQHQWTFLLGTNWTNFPVFEKLGFYRLDTPRGQKLFARLNYTNEELRHEGIATGALDSPAVL